MRYAIMSDAHANLQALERALQDSRAKGCEKHIFLGDITGYGSAVKETLDLVRSSFDVVLLGNHDAVCAGLYRGQYVASNPNYDLDRAAAKSLSAEDKAWLKNSALVYAENGAAFVHGDFIEPASWDYILELDDARRNFYARDERLLFCGHTHIPAVWEETEFGGYKHHEGGSFTPNERSRYIINVGSVGNSRAYPKYSYVIWDDQSRRIECHKFFFANGW